MIHLENITRKYRAGEVETTALDSVSLDIARGEFVSLMGPSGCGKSTLLNIVGLIDVPDSGAYRFDGQDIASIPEEKLVGLRRRNIGFIFQNFNLIDDLTVQENVELPLVYNGVPRNRRKVTVREALELVELPHRAKHKPPQLSGGQQQRVAIARAVAGDPALILADEPTGNLDSDNGEAVLDMLQVLHAQGATILMVTHSAGHAERAQRILKMQDGRIVPALAEAV